jgi:hypothetical protein
VLYEDYNAVSCPLLWSNAKIRKRAKDYARNWGCTEQTFLGAFASAVKRVAKERKENLSKLRAPKQDFPDGLKLHKIETLKKLHEVLNQQCMEAAQSTTQKSTWSQIPLGGNSNAGPGAFASFQVRFSRSEWDPGGGN